MVVWDIVVRKYTTLHEALRVTYLSSYPYHDVVVVVVVVVVAFVFVFACTRQYSSFVLLTIFILLFVSFSLYYYLYIYKIVVYQISVSFLFVNCIIEEEQQEKRTDFVRIKNNVKYYSIIAKNLKQIFPLYL